MKCFVPTCENTKGIPFPTDEIAKQLWLEELNIKNVIPNQESIVCLDHFKESDIVTDTDERGDGTSYSIRKDALPFILQSENAITKLDGLNFDETANDDDLDKICRMCMKRENLVKTIQDTIEGDIPIASVLMLCAFPLKIPKDDDVLPKSVCNDCYNTLTLAHKLRLKVLECDEILKKKLAKKLQQSSAPKRKNQESSQDDVVAKKLKSDNIPSRTKVEIFHPEEEEELYTEENDKLTDPLSTKIVEYSSAPTDSEGSFELDTSDEEYVRMVTRTNKKKEKENTSKKATEFEKSGKDIGVKENKETLNRITKIIVEDDIQNNKDVPTVSSNKKNPAAIKNAATPLVPLGGGKTVLKLGQVTAKIVSYGTPGTSKQMSTSKTQSSSEKFAITEDEPPKKGKHLNRTKPSILSRNKVVKEVSIDMYNVPDFIKIKPAEIFLSKEGLFPCNFRLGICNSTFVEADQYLFIFGLMKNKLRNLQCLVQSCKATAEQRLLDNGEYENQILVKCPHNHSAPSEATKKKEMFFYVMRKKMQNDKALNIRNIYEEICIEEPELRNLVPLRNVINEICRYQFSYKIPAITSFHHLYDIIETDVFERLHFTHSGQQFYQERFSADDGSLALVFCNTAILEQVCDSTIMYVDASFKIDTEEDFKYQLVTVLVWLDDSYYPILFALVNKKTQDIFRKVFVHLRDVLAPKLKPQQIITDYEASLYYALGETYLESHIGGSVFYYTQNIYKKVCSLNLSRDLETNSYFRNIYHMILMLPLLPVNTILDGLNNIEIQARDMGLQDLSRPIFDHVRTQWILNVTPELFCVHRLENRINENVIAPFKKLRDFLLLTKGKMQKTQFTIVHVIGKLIELESFLSGMYSKPDKKSFGRDLSTSQKKTVLRAWQFIEAHPKININNFFSKVLGYIKCMENQLWIWGFYRYIGDTDDNLINASNFSIVSTDDLQQELYEEQDVDDLSDHGGINQHLQHVQVQETAEGTSETDGNAIVMEAVIDENGGVVLQSKEGGPIVVQDDMNIEDPGVQKFESAFLKYVINEQTNVNF